MAAKNLRLKAEMAHRELSIADLAKQIGMHKGTLMRKINGLNAFRIDEAEAILGVLGIPVAEGGSIFFRGGG